MEQKPKQLDPSQMANWTIAEYLKKLSSDEPVPGGGSVAALSGALGAALIVMYCRLGVQRKGVSSDDQDVLQKINIEASSYQQRLTKLITDDCLAYAEVMQAYKLPKTTEEESQARLAAIQKAFRNAVETPMQTLNACLECLYLISEVALIGNPAAFSDLKVAESMCLSGAQGAIENIEINLPSIKDPAYIKMVEAPLTKFKGTLEEVSKRRLSRPSS